MLEQTFEELKLAGNLPSPSGIGMKILTLTQGEDYSTKDIAETIQADPALTGRLLKLANSALSGSVVPITTVEESTMRLGVRSVRNVALGLSLVSGNREGACKSFDYDHYWADSLARAVAAKLLSARSGLQVPAEMYVCGLLSNIGSLALACAYPKEYSDQIEAVTGKPLGERVRAERNRFAITRGEIAAFMMSDLGLPSVYGKSVLTYEEEAESAARMPTPPPLATMADILGGAVIIARVCCSGADEDQARQVRFRAELECLQQRLGENAESFNELCNEVAEEWREWCGLLTIPMGTSVDFSLINSPDTLDEEKVKAVIDMAVETPKERKQLEFQPGNGLRVLAVDDDEMQLKLVERYLTRLGARVTVARDGRQALQEALAKTPQVVIADWMMPGMDGVDLCRALRRIRQGREMYFLLLTGREDEEKVVEAFDAGVDDYVVKPFNPKLLLARIKAGMRVVELEDERARDRATLIKQGAELSRSERKFKALAMTDILTKLRNRRYAIERLVQEWSNGSRDAKPLSVITVDIDYFKKVNDTYGHDAGDRVLSETARILRDEIRTGDDAVRMGGEEFLIICYGTEASQAMICAERVRKSVEKNVVCVGDFEIGVTVSLGVAERTPEMQSIDDLLKASDVAVYQAKDAGRNRACIYLDAEEEGKRESA
jgi:diguanylate cyclase (GGDEF)-like protein